jgi:hypothetical protein
MGWVWSQLGLLGKLHCGSVKSLYVLGLFHRCSERGTSLPSIWRGFLEVAMVP